MSQKEYEVVYLEHISAITKLIPELVHIIFEYGAHSRDEWIIMHMAESHNRSLQIGVNWKIQGINDLILRIFTSTHFIILRQRDPYWIITSILTGEIYEILDDNIHRLHLSLPHTASNLVSDQLKRAYNAAYNQLEIVLANIRDQK